ncbi:MAG: hypothetical protein RIQ33_2250 [Bacteroidota bacterium]
MLINKVAQHQNVNNLRLDIELKKSKNLFIKL